MTTIGSQAQTGPIVSVSGVSLASGAKVTGDVKSAGPVTLGNGATVTGNVTANTAVALRSRSIELDFGSGSLGNLTVNSGQTHVAVPGSYGSIIVDGTLKLRNGVYYASSLTLNSGSRVELDGTAGSITIFVKGAAILRPTWVSTGAPRLFVASLGTSVIPVESNFAGTLVAPNAKLVISSGGPFMGQAYAKDIELSTDRVWNERPFGRWGEVLVARVPPTVGVIGQENVAALLPQNAVGNAIMAFIRADHVGSSDTNTSYALAALRAQPSAQVGAALANALDATTSPMTKHGLLSVAVSWGGVEALPIFASILSASNVPSPAFQFPSAVDDRGPVIYGAVAQAALRGVVGLTMSGSGPARQLLLDTAVAHPLDAIRSVAIASIVQMADPSLSADLSARIKPADQRWLNLRPITGQDLATATAGIGIPPIKPEPVPSPPPVTGSGAGGAPVSLPVPGTTGGVSGGSSGGPCSEATAVDLGRDGNNVTVWNNGCIRVRDQYPPWWSTATKMRLENTTPGTYPVPFTWTSSCIGTSGSGTFTADWQAFTLGNTSRSCATIIDLKGNGAGTVTLRYWGT